MHRLLTIILCLLLICQTKAYAALDILLTQGVNSALPIAIVSFAGQDDARSPNNLTSVITADLQNSGRFRPLDAHNMQQRPHTANNVDVNYWRSTGVESVVVGSMQPLGADQYEVNFSLVDVFKGQQSGNSILAKQKFTVAEKDLRRLAHHISNIIYQRLTNERGVFSTRIAYIVVQQPAHFQLEIADADGYNPKPLLSSSEPIMSPAWSHDGRQISYVSFENNRAQIYVANVATGQRKLISSFPGINGAPAWSPDDKKLALVLSKGGIAKIYTLDLAAGKLQQITFGDSLDTEPNWAPDGRSIVYTSDRGGAPQIYQINLGKPDKSRRLTFIGEYNARSSLTPDGRSLVMLHRENGMYNIAVQELQSGNLQVLTDSGHDDSPSVAPNGSMIIYGTEYGVLGVVSNDGRVKLRLPAREGKVQDPAWSPF